MVLPASPRGRAARFADRVCASDADALRVAHAEFVRAVQQALSARAVCVVALSGGTTPRALYAALAADASIEWARVHLVLVDERCVPPAHADAAQRLLSDTLLRDDGAPRRHGVRCTFPATASLAGDPDACARDYSARLRDVLAAAGSGGGGGGGGGIDVCVLGMGDDGHIASLFPGRPDGVDRWSGTGADDAAAHTTTDRFAVHDRVTLRLDVLATSRTALVLLNASKGAVWRELVADVGAGRDTPARWPLSALLHAPSCDVVVVRVDE